MKLDKIKGKIVSEVMDKWDGGNQLTKQGSEQ